MLKLFLFDKVWSESMGSTVQLDWQVLPYPKQSWPANKGKAALRWWTACVWPCSLSPGWGRPQSWQGRRTWRRWRRWKPAHLLMLSSWEREKRAKEAMRGLVSKWSNRRLRDFESSPVWTVILTAPPVTAAPWWGSAGDCRQWCQTLQGLCRLADLPAGRHCSSHWGKNRYCASPCCWTRSGERKRQSFQFLWLQEIQSSLGVN